MKLAPHVFTLRQLQYAVAVAEERSFRRAAARAGVSQPGLSAQIAELEGAVGVQLFERTQRRVLVTAAGEELVARARRLLLEADEIERAARRVGDPLSGTLHLGVIPTISPYLLPSVTPALRGALPRLRIAWLEDKTAVLVAKLRQGEIDGALLALEADVGDVASEVIATDAFAVVTPPDHPLARRKGAVTEAELRGQELMLLAEGHCFRDQALEACRASRVREGELRATSLSTLVQMVAGGDGITLVPELALEAETRRADLAVRPLAAPAAHRTIALVWRRGAALEAALRAVAKAIREAYPRPPRRVRARA